MQHAPIILPDGAARVLVCIDSVCDAELHGRWYNPYRLNGQPFENVVGLLGGLERLYNTLMFPQSTVQLRCLGRSSRPQPSERKEVIRYMDDKSINAERGEKATFVVQIQFRQNATWQGTVTWAEKNSTCHFRSALELLKLMDESLQQETQPEEEKAAW